MKSYLYMLEAFVETGGTRHDPEKVQGGENDHADEILQLKEVLSERSTKRMAEASALEHTRAEAKHTAGHLARLEETIRERRTDHKRRPAAATATNFITVTKILESS